MLQRLDKKMQPYIFGERGVREGWGTRYKVVKNVCYPDKFLLYIIMYSKEIYGYVRTIGKQTHFFWILLKLQSESRS